MGEFCVRAETHTAIYRDARAEMAGKIGGKRKVGREKDGKAIFAVSADKGTRQRPTFAVFLLDAHGKDAHRRVLFLCTRQTYGGKFMVGTDRPTWPYWFAVFPLKTHGKDQPL